MAEEVSAKVVMATKEWRIMMMMIMIATRLLRAAGQRVEKNT
jgi:hypothetical protein